MAGLERIIYIFGTPGIITVTTRIRHQTFCFGRGVLNRHINAGNKDGIVEQCLAETMELT